MTAAWCLVSFVLSAQERTDAEMATIARKQMATVMSSNHNGAKGLATSRTEKKLVEGRIALYNVENAGMVFVSTDSRFPEVLGYTLGVQNGTETMPCCLKAWISDINMQMEAVSESADVQDKALASRADAPEYVRGVVIEPLVTTKWGQDYPYNSLTPEHNGKNAVTGCVATAFAQILNYNKYPAEVDFAGSYSLGEGLSKVGLVNSTYQWDQFKDVYERDCTQEDAELIGTLLRDCGYACDMNYSAGSSGAYEHSLLNPLVKYYKYPKESVKYIRRELYSDAEWYNIVVSELAHNTPILYTGAGDSGGHAFVVHGIDSEGRVCVNWGWTGSYDGYYSMDLMNPGSSKFNVGQAAIIGIRKDAIATDVIQSAFKGSLIVTTSDKGELLLTSDGYIYNESPAKFNGKIDLVLEDAANPSTKLRNTVRKTSGIGGKPIDGFYGFQISVPVNVATQKGIAGNLVADATYKLYLESQSSEQQEMDDNLWSRVRNNGAPYFLVKYDGTNLVLLSEGIDNLVTDGVRTVTNVAPKISSATYNLSGQKVNGDSYRGIVIRNGKKYIN